MYVFGLVMFAFYGYIKHTNTSFCILNFYKEYFPLKLLCIYSIYMYFLCKVFVHETRKIAACFMNILYIKFQN